MALTRITKGVIKPNENYDTHDINSTGIITATGLNISGNASIGGVLTYEDVTNIDSIGIITARSGVDVDDFLSVGSNIHLGNAGVVTATSFSGDGSGLTGLSADKIFEGNTKAEVSDTGSNGRFFVETEGAEKFSIDSVGNFTFNKAHDNVINADGDITIDYKTSGATRIRNFTKSGGFHFFPMNDNYPFIIGSGFGSDEVEIYRTGEVKVGSGITLSGSTGNIIVTGIVTASNFVGDGSSLTNILVSSDAQFNTVGGSDAATNRTHNAYYNTIFGYQAGKSIFNSDGNTAIGYQTLENMASGGNYNTCIGQGAGKLSLNASYNAFLGSYSGSNCDSEWNVALGYQTLSGGSTQVTGGYNVALGGRALYNISSGTNNVGIGYGVGYGNNGDVKLISGSNNILIGFEAAPTSTSVSNEITLGNSSITKLRVPGIGVTFSTNGNHISGVTTFTGEIHGDGQRLGSLSGGGRFSGLFLNNGASYYGTNKLFVADGNGFGLDAYGSNDAWLKANSGGGSSGDCWMKTGGSSGGYIIAKGADGVELHHSGTSDKKLETVSGGVNVVGSLTVNGAALQSGIAGIDTTGTSHFNHLSVTGIATFSGTEAIFNRVSFPQSGNKTIVGNMAGSAPTGSEITLVGYAAGYASSGDRLTAVGRQAGRMVSGTDNTCIGYEAGYSNQGAQKNVFVGKDAGMGNKTGSNNIVVGSDAGEGVWNNANYSNSVILGAEAGAILTSNNSNVIVIGYDAEPSSNSVTNEITLGNSSINHLRLPGIGVTFSTSGNHITGLTTITSLMVENYDGNGNTGIMTVPWKLGQVYSGGGNGGGTSNQVWGENAGANLNLSAATENIIIGRQAAKGLDRGDSNIFIGADAGPYNTSNNYENCDNNTVVSGYSMYFAGPNAKGNSAFGYHSSYDLRNAQYNTTMGYASGYNVMNGGECVLIGHDAARGTGPYHPNSLVAIGSSAAKSVTSAQNVIVIGNNADPSSNTPSNEITLGDSSINHLRVPGIGVTFATSGNHITGITTFSDRIKLGNSGNGELYYSGGIKMVSTAQIELESANQLYIHAQSSGLFLRASNQEVISVYGGSGGGVYFRHNGNQKLKLEGGNWTYQGSATVTFDNHLYASSDSAIDIGTNSVRFRNIYADTLYGDGSNLTGISGGGGGGVTSDSEENTVAGTDAGAALDSDTYRNTLFGFDTGKSINSGDDNTIMGWKAGDAITSGYKNCAVGSEALPNCNSGHNNVAMGWEAGRSLTSGNNNVCLGPMAGRSLGGGTYNIALGYHALSNVGSPTRCIGIGGDSIFLGGTDVIGIGQGTMMRGNSQIGGIGIGRYAGRNNAGDHNVYIGYEAGHGYGSSSPYSTGNYNVSMGYHSLYDIKEGHANVAIGASAGKNVTDGFGHVLIGVNAGAGVTTAQQSVYIGYEAAENTHQGRQVAIGWRALRYTGNSTPGYRGNNHTAIGNNCMSNLSIYSNYNTAVGDGAMQYATAGFNAAFGYGALRSGSGEINTALGMNALNNTSGSWNCAIGYNAGDDCTGGSKNCLLGVYAGEDIGSGSHNVCLGAYSTVSASGVSNECVIGAPSGHASEINHVRMPGIGVSFSAGGAVISGVVTATSFVGDGSALTGVTASASITSDAQENTVGGTGAGANFSGTSARDNTLFGHNTGNDITSGDYNTCYGSSAGELLSTGHSNTCIGSDALRKGINTTVHSNVMVGRDAGKEGTSTNKNVAVGNEAFKEATSSIECVFVGYGAGSNITSGSYNVAVGQNAGVGEYNNASANYNTSIGHEAGKRYSTGHSNSCLGVFAGDNITTGSNNVCIGANAGDTGSSNLTTGSNNILIGHDAEASSSGISNEVTIGDTNISNFRVPGVHIGITANAASLPAAIFRPGVIQETYYNDTGSGIQQNYTHDILTYGMVFYGVTNAAGSWTFNIRGDASTTFNSLTSTGKVTTMTVYSANNSTSNYMTAFKIDGTTQTVKWAGGSAPSAATGSGVDVYSMTIMKTGANTYHVFGNVTNFA